jgi:hypothetical protein
VEKCSLIKKILDCLQLKHPSLTMNSINTEINTDRQHKKLIHTSKGYKSYQDKIQPLEIKCVMHRKI